MNNIATSETRKPVCSLIIRCCNEEQHIGRLLSCIMEQSVKDTEIILVDSGSTDATLSIANKHPIKVIHIRPETFTFGRSLNIGCAYATSDIIVIASAHIYPVYNDWLANLIKPFNDPNVGIVYGKQRSDDNAWFSEQQIYRKWYPDQSSTHQKHPFCNNANAAIRKSLWERYPYNQELTGLEDIEWAKRVFEAGNKIVYNVNAEIIHVHNETTRQIYNRYKREAIAFNKIYPQERFNLIDFIMLFSANVLSDCFQAWHKSVLLKNIPGIVIYRFMQFFGTYRGYRQKGMVPKELANRFYYPHGFSNVNETKGEEQERRTNYAQHN